MWDDAVLHLPIKVEPLVDWSRGRGTPWNPLDVVSGGHSSDATQTTRWTTSGVFVGGEYPIGSTGIHAKGCRMRVRQKVTAAGFGSLIVPAGVYSITSVVEAWNNLSLTGDSFETDCIDSTFPTARSFPSTSQQTLRTQAEGLILEAVPDATFIWDDTLQADLPMPTMQVDSDRWGTVDGNQASTSILRSIGGIAFCNSFGAFQFAPVPSLGANPIGSITRGETMILPQSTSDRQGVYNLIVVTGTPAAGGATIGPCFAWDSDPTSDTYAGPDPLNHPELAGNFGVKPYRYDSPLITDTGQGTNVAQALLRTGLGAHEVITADAAYNPFYEAGDTVAIQNNSGILVPRLLDTVATTWFEAKVSLTTRSPKEDLQ